MTLVRNTDDLWLLAGGDLLLIPEGMTGRVLERKPGGILSVQWDACVGMGDDGMPVPFEGLITDDVLEGEEAVATSESFPLGPLELDAAMTREDTDDYFMGDVIGGDDDEEDAGVGGRAVA